jgi:hypothetical protein
MNTAFLLLAQFGRTVIPIEHVRQDFFGHLSPAEFRRKLAAGDIDLAVVRMEKSQKSALGVHLQDLATYVDQRRAAAERERLALQGPSDALISGPSMPARNRRE